MSSRLLELPRELRDTIYEYTFSDTVVSTDTSGHQACNSGLLGTNKQIRHEAFPVYYKLTIFTVPFHELDSYTNLLRFLQSANIERVKELRLEETGRGNMHNKAVLEWQLNETPQVRMVGNRVLKTLFVYGVDLSSGGPAGIWCSFGQWKHEEILCTCGWCPNNSF